LFQACDQLFPKILFLKRKLWLAGIFLTNCSLKFLQPEFCRGTGLFKAFSEHFLHRMGITNEHNKPVVPVTKAEVPKSIRVTLLDRGKRDNYQVYRRILNQDELVSAIRKIPHLKVKVRFLVIFGKKSFAVH